MAGTEKLQQFTLLDASETGIDFKNDLIEDISKQMDVLSYQYYFNGGGVAIIDVNNDGLSDVFLTANTGSNRLYLNRGGMHFEDITEKAGLHDQYWSTGATVADINNDGWEDLYVCNGGVYTEPSDRENKLYLNNGDNTFTEKGGSYGINDGNRSTQAAFFDHDGDGDLDLYVMNHAAYFRVALDAVFEDLQDPTRLKAASGTMYRNNGDGTFTDITEQAGMLRYGYGLGLVVSDLNADGRPDVYVANDFSVPDMMYINNGDGSFSDRQNTTTAQISWFGMGCDIADFNNDGLVDIGVVDMAANDHIRGKTLMASMDPESFDQLVNRLGYQYQYMFNSMQLNHGNGRFSNIANLTGTAKTDWSWAALFADLDNDGLKDYFVTNGYRRYALDNDFRAMMEQVRSEYPDQQVPMARRKELYQKIPTVKLANLMYRNLGDLAFTDVAEDWGLGRPSYSNGAAFADLDNDGDLDLVVNNIHETAFVYRNNAEMLGNGQFLRIRLEKLDSNDQLLNTKVTLHTSNGMQFQEFTRTRGFQGSMEGVVHFGLGDQTTVDRLVIEWPDGTKRVIKNVEAGQLLHINRSDGAPFEQTISPIIPTLAEIPAELSGLSFVHRENEFNDFAQEILLPHKQSRLGPFLGVGDANGDGLKDIFVGGAKDQAGMLYLQGRNGRFSPAPDQPFAMDKAYEDMGALFFDANGDGLNDLYVVSGGGSEFEEGSTLLQDRLYLNKGSARFERANVLPMMHSSGSRVGCADMDNDGDLDLFVGGRTIPGKYPMAPRSYLLRNENGRFEDVTHQLAPALVAPGMVTDLVWTDLDRDGQLDLVIVGEWMPVRMFRNQGGSFVEVTREMGTAGSAGWWYSIASADLDQDGDMDLVCGNIGTNTKFSASQEHPLVIHYGDLDENGTGDIVLAKDYKGRPVPVRGRECSSQQMPFIKEKFPTYKQFAEASLPDIYGEEKLKSSLRLEAREFRTSVLINNGEAGFDVRPLPVQAQFSATNGIVVQDLDNDGHLDILLAGNMFHTEVETPRYDAGIGCFLRGDGIGGFRHVPLQRSGFFAPGDVKDVRGIELFGSGHTQHAIVLSNNGGMLQLFTTQDDPPQQKAEM